MKTAKQHIIISTYDDIDNPHYGGGGAIAVHEVARRLSSDYRVTVLSGMFPGASARLIRDGVTYIHIGTTGLGSKLGQMAFSAILPYYARQMKYDLWIESFTPPFSTSTLPLVCHKPVIGLVHMLAAQDMERKYKLPFRLIENAGLKWYRSFIVLNMSMKKKVLAANPNAQVTVIPNGVTMPHEKVQLEGKYFLFMGRIEMNQKGLDLLLNSYAAVNHKLNHPLIIAGTGNENELKHLKHHIHRLNLENHVKLVGRVTGAAKEDLFRKCLAVVCPSRFETFPLIALETMSYKKCLVGFDIEGLNWIPDSCRAKVPQFSVEGLSKKLVQLSSAPDQATAIGERSFEFVKQYDWTTATKQYKEFIAETLRQARAVSPVWQFGARS